MDNNNKFPDNGDLEEPSGSNSDEDIQANGSTSSSEGRQDGNDEGSKRQRIISGSGSPSPGSMPGYMLPGIAASPPRFISLEQIMKAANAVSKMTLAHEIAVNKDFKLEKVEPEDGLYSRVKQIAHQAFWDVFKSQLNDDPPSYDHAMSLLQEIKEGLLSLLLPHHTKQKQEIDDALDIDLIRQQTENGSLDFPYYAQYILSIMSKMCAPVRDDRIRELMRYDDIIGLFKGIFETLELMKLDMANFHIQMIRPTIQQHSVEYEKERFAEFLNLHDDGLEFTRRWLTSAAEKSLKPVTLSSVLSKAYMALLQWDKKEAFPETLMMDKSRFADLCVRFEKTTLIAAIMLVTYSTVGSAITGLTQFKEDLKNHLNILLESYDPSKDHSEMVSNVAVQVVTDVKNCLTKHGYGQLPDEVERVLKGQIEETVLPEHRVRCLVHTRILEFTEQCISSSSAYPIKIPPGLSIMQLELSEITGQFLRLVSHNRAVFSSIYTDMLKSGQFLTNTTEVNGVENQATSLSPTDSTT